MLLRLLHPRDIINERGRSNDLILHQTVKSQRLQIEYMYSYNQEKNSSEAARLECTLLVPRVSSIYSQYVAQLATV